MFDLAPINLRIKIKTESGLDAALIITPNTDAPAEHQAGRYAAFGVASVQVGMDILFTMQIEAMVKPYPLFMVTGPRSKRRTPFGAGPFRVSVNDLCFWVDGGEERRIVKTGLFAAWPAEPAAG